MEIESTRCTHQAGHCPGRNVGAVHLHIQSKNNGVLQKCQRQFSTLQQSTSCHKTNSHDLEKQKRNNTKSSPAASTERLAVCRGRGASRYRCIKGFLRTCLRFCLKLLLGPSSQQCFSVCSGQHTLHTAGNAGCRGETLPWLALLCPGSLRAAALALPGFLCSDLLAATSRNHISTSLHLYKAQQQNQLTWSGWEPGQEHACTSQLGERSAEPWRNRQDQAPTRTATPKPYL